ncbi:bifunctional nicotinamidase/pyrazinamidase [Martelella alba]|uniref:nicotinamidase n=1 Tax=Martelella alba TaxID=2590451 RepID=A0ABY2SPZ0_9HYPH|nr:bifunctional nicotinamidase/pyrazinamidase [Martelella alba]TKI08167.1 bifunctional nicotinamidase/pyrazinamidase [Martelella alba]
MKQALILIDLQNDFCQGGALAVPDGDAVIPVANEAMTVSRRRGIPVVASIDWHPADHRSFAINSGGEIGELGELEGLPQVWWPVHCVQHSPGAQLHPALNAAGIDQRVYKGCQTDIDSYSAFYDNGHRGRTVLHAWLKERNISALLIMGLATDYCVKFTVLDALSLGYTVMVLTDGCRGVDLTPGDSGAALEAMRMAGARLATLVDFVREPGLWDCAPG